MNTTFLQRYWFLLALFCVIPLGLAWPAGGLWIKQSGWVTPLLVATVLGISGFMADTRAMLRQATNWRAILMVFASVYVVAPLAAWQLAKVFGSGLPDAASAHFLEAMLIMAAQASTMASAVALTLLARGNSELAIVVALLTNMSTVLFTPVILRLALHAENVSFETSRMMLNMSCTVLLPVLLGQLLRRYYWERAEAIRAVLRVAPQCIILIFVYTGFAAAAQSLKGDSGILFRYLGCCATLHALLLSGNILAARCLHLDGPTQTAVSFAGAQKTLPNGIFLWERFFAANPQGAVPLVFYHAIQLLVDTLLVGWFEKQNRAPAKPS